MARHLMLLAALFLQPYPGAATLHIDILDPHAEGGTDAGEAVDHEPDQGAIAQTGEGGGVDRIQQRPRSVGGQHRGLPLAHRMLMHTH